MAEHLDSIEEDKSSLGLTLELKLDSENQECEEDIFFTQQVPTRRAKKITNRPNSLIPADESIPKVQFAKEQTEIQISLEEEEMEDTSHTPTETTSNSTRLTPPSPDSPSDSDTDSQPKEEKFVFSFPKTKNIQSNSELDVTENKRRRIST